MNPIQVNFVQTAGPHKTRAANWQTIHSPGGKLLALILRPKKPTCKTLYRHPTFAYLPPHPVCMSPVCSRLAWTSRLRSFVLLPLEPFQLAAVRSGAVRQTCWLTGYQRLARATSRHSKLLAAVGSALLVPARNRIWKLATGPIQRYPTRRSDISPSI